MRQVPPRPSSPPCQHSRYYLPQCPYFFPDPQAEVVAHCRQGEGAYPGLFRLMRDFFIGQVRLF